MREGYLFRKIAYFIRVVKILANSFNYKYTYFRGSEQYYKAQFDIINQLKSAEATINDYNNINKALKFLDKVAKNEQQKELDSITGFIEKQKNELSQFIPNFEKSELKKKLDNPQAAIENIEQFYNEFIIALNSARRGIDNTKKRIETIQRNINNESRHFSHYQGDDYRFKLTNDISSFIKRLTGQYRKGDINDNDVSAKLQTIAVQTMNQMNLAERVASGENLIALGSIILTDLEQQAQKYLDQYIEETGKMGATFEDLSDKIFDEIRNTYLQGIKSNNPRTKIQQMLLESLNNIEDSVLNTPMINVKTILNLKPKIKQAQNIVGKTTAKNKILEKELSNLRESVSHNKYLNNSLYTITFTQGSSRGAHGDINELVESILTGTKVRANVATDLITYTFKYDIQRDKKLDETTMNMAEKLSSIADYLSTQKDADTRELTPILNDVNKSLRDTIDELDKNLQKINPDEKLYITHETLKLSTRAERGFEFHGRSMSIFSYISYLCSTNVEGFNAGDEQMLQFLAYNLIHGAAADDMIGPLERYFSMFAGLLMFDDVQNMALEATSEVSSIDNKHVLQIHLYNLNGLYIPASMILLHIRDELNNIADLATSNLGAQAHISINSDASPNKDYVIRAAAAKKTKVNITFLGGFTNLINNLFPN